MKRIISIVLTLAVLLSVFAGLGISSNAAGNDCYAVLESVVDLPTFRATVASGLANCDEYIDISSFNISNNTQNQTALTYYIRYYLPEYFHLSKISYVPYNGIFLRLKMTYDQRYNTKEKFEAAKAEFDTQVNTLLSGIRGNSALNDEQKALLVHDRLVAYLDFDLGAYTGNINPDSFNLTGVFFNRVAVCNGYSIAYSYLMNLVGLRCYVVNSEMMEHAWDIVYVDGVPYYVDCTWDDPVYTFPGYVKHENFLRSYEGILQTGHSVDGQVDYVTNVRVNSTKYDSYYWQNSFAQFQLLNNHIYYVDNINHTFASAITGEVLLTIDAQWMPDAAHYYYDIYSRLVCDGRSLYLNLPDSVCKLDLVTKTLQPLFTPDVSAFGEFFSIYGLKYADGLFTCYYYNNANFDPAETPKYAVQQAYENTVLVSVEYDTVQGKVTGAGEYAKGEQVTLEAANLPGYRFVGFYREDTMIGDGSNVLNFNATEDVEILAVYEACSHPAEQMLAETVEPTCTQEGYTAKRCAVCGYEIKESIIPAAGHDWGEWSVQTPATCSAEGTEIRVCSRDTAHVSTQSIPKLRHTPATTVEKIFEQPATCTQAGYYQMAVLCAVCREPLDTQTYTIPATGHDPSVKKVVAPTATALGYTMHKCSNCGMVVRVDSYVAPTGKPIGFQCKARSATAQVLVWSKIADVSGYQIQISNAAGTQWVMGVNTTATSYTVKNLTPGGAYKIRMRFYYKMDDGKNYFSAWSTIVSPTLPAGSAITKLTPAKKAFTAQWKYNKAVNGYQIQYCTNAKFTGAKTLTVKSPKVLKAAMKNLSAKKVYYVRIRTYKTIAKANYFSAWSGTYKVLTK